MRLKPSVRGSNCGYRIPWREGEPGWTSVSWPWGWSGAHPNLFPPHGSFPPRCLREEAWKLGGGWMVKDYMRAPCNG